jgi:predicted transcriptional regulator
MKNVLTPREFRAMRNKLGVSQHKMAEILGYNTRSMICHLESGNRQITPRLTLTMNLLMEKHDDKLAQRT